MHVRRIVFKSFFVHPLYSLKLLIESIMETLQKLQ